MNDDVTYIWQHVMVDLETMGKGPRAAIVAIGAVCFDSGGPGPEFSRCIDLASSVRFGLEMDASTVAFWLSQPEPARQALTVEPVGLDVGLAMLNAWLGRHVDLGFCLWGNGATFDNVILASAYQATGLERPWGYRQDRCYRTLSALAPDVEFVPPTLKHSAVDDARAQAAHAARVLTALRRPVTP